MKQFRRKNLIFRSILILLLLISAVVIHSCKKDKQEKTPVSISTDPLISQAKKWYDSVYKAVSDNSKLATQSVGQKPSHDWSKRFFPDWTHAKTYTMYGNTCIEMPAIQVGNMAICFSKPMDSTKFDFSRSGSKTSLLIVKAQNAMNMYAMTIVADSSYLKGNYNLLANNTYQKIDTNFTGTIFFNQMDGTFVNGWIYKNGVITRQLSPASTSNGQAIQSINSDKLHVDEETPGCGAIVSVTVYEDCYTYPSGTSLCYITSDTNVAEDCPTTSGGGGSGGATGGGGGGTSPCTVPPANSSVQQVVINSTPTRGFTVNVAMPPPGGGTTTPCTETTTTQTITDNVSNPCLKGLLDNLAINNTLQTDVTSMLRNTFGTSDVINITFVDGDFTSTLGTADAGTDGLSYNNFEVKFNTPIIKDGSKEFLLETAMHEIYHAYLYANPTVKGNLTQHAYMIQNYVNAEVQTLRQVFPNLSIHDAECLVLSGYGDLDANTLNTAIASYGLTLNDVTTTNTQYKSGVSGTKCPVL